MRLPGSAMKTPFQVALSVAFPIPSCIDHSRGAQTTATHGQRGRGRVVQLSLPLACQIGWSVWRRLFAEGEEIIKLKMAQNVVNENT